MTRFVAWLDRNSGAIIGGALSVMAAASGAGAAFMWGIAGNLGELKSDVQHTSNAIKELRGVQGDTYTVERAKEAHSRIWETDADQYQRIKVLEGQVRENQVKIDQNSVVIERLRRGRDAIWIPYRRGLWPGYVYSVLRQRHPELVRVSVPYRPGCRPWLES